MYFMTYIFKHIFDFIYIGLEEIDDSGLSLD